MFEKRWDREFYRKGVRNWEKSKKTIEKQP